MQQQQASTLLLLGLLVAALTRLENCYLVECLSVVGLQQHQPNALLGSTTMAMAKTTRGPFFVSFPKTRGVLKMNLGNDEDDEEDDDDDDEDDDGPRSCNVLGSSLCPCCDNVRETGIGTGFYRNGFCSTGPDDLGRHTVCVQVTDQFLTFSKSAGNDLSTPVPEFMFPGLKEGDIWCLCAQRWVQAYNAGMAPKLYLKATHEKTLDYVPMEVLRLFALDGEEADRLVDELNEQRSRLDKLF